MQNNQDIVHLNKIADHVYSKYKSFYGVEFMKGPNVLIAEEISTKTGASIHAGILRVDDDEISPHFWCERYGIRLDPIYNEMKKRYRKVSIERVDSSEFDFHNSVERYRVYQLE